MQSNTFFFLIAYILKKLTLKNSMICYKIAELGTMKKPFCPYILCKHVKNTSNLYNFTKLFDEYYSIFRAYTA